MGPIAREWRLAMHQQNKAEEEKQKLARARDLVIAGGRETFRTWNCGNIQLFLAPDVDQGDFEHCLHRDTYTLWKCRGIT